MKELLVFSATWCSPCRTMKPIVNQVENELGQSTRVTRLDAEDSPLAQRYSISSVPTFILLKDGTEVARSTGAMPKSKLVAMIEGA